VACIWSSTVSPTGTCIVGGSHFVRSPPGGGTPMTVTHLPWFSGAPQSSQRTSGGA
jgi:hypothetical protein